ncbi:unnamed protein product [Lasius platythorax]|uniref:Uncharacterized protein n=1 Tax=Lasius platythorax TaxID=488582 RepID=A0AAV2NEM2_9HYME
MFRHKLEGMSLKELQAEARRCGIMPLPKTIKSCIESIMVMLMLKMDNINVLLDLERRMFTMMLCLVKLKILRLYLILRYLRFKKNILFLQIFNMCLLVLSHVVFSQGLRRMIMPFLNYVLL